MYSIHIQYGMKMTLNIDAALLERVMRVTGAKTKTAAIDLALKEMDRKGRLREVLSRDRGMTPTDWKNAFEPGYDLDALRAAEAPATYARKPRSRR
jgi:Arc/MetJ family transcription regulator